MYSSFLVFLKDTVFKIAIFEGLEGHSLASCRDKSNYDVLHSAKAAFLYIRNVHRSPYTFDLEDGLKSTRFITVTRTTSVTIRTRQAFPQFLTKGFFLYKI
jgi:hypothetical protein